MLSPTLETRLVWRPDAAPASAALRRRVEAEVRDVSWTLSQLQTIVHDASSVASSHAFLLPRLEVRLPLYDAGLRYRVRLDEVDGPRIVLVDDDGRRVADIVLI